MRFPAYFNKFDAINIKGEKFLLLKEDYLKELLVLFRSFVVGEAILKNNKTRSFDSFFKSIARIRK